MALLRKLTGDQKRTVAHWAMELVIVVAGVLIALGVQQWSDDRHAHRDMVAAEAAIHDEIRQTLTGLIWRGVVSRCHFERAERLKTMLLASNGDWPGIDENALMSEAEKLMRRKKIKALVVINAQGLTTGLVEIFDRQHDAPVGPEV